MRRSLSVAVFTCFALGFLCTGTQAQNTADADTTWQYHVAPYIWFTGINGDVTVKGLKVPVDASFSDLAEKLNFGFMLHFDAQNGQWGYFLDSMFISLSTDSPQAHADMTQWLVEFGGSYRLLNQGKGLTGKKDTLDLLLGGRFWSQDVELDTTTGAILSGDQSWVDPFLGARYMTDLSKQWLVTGRFDLGGFGVGSHFTWNVVALVGYRLAKNGTLGLGYRALSYNRTGSHDADFDITFHGPILGYDFRF